MWVLPDPPDPRDRRVRKGRRVTPDPLARKPNPDPPVRPGRPDRKATPALPDPRDRLESEASRGRPVPLGQGERCRRPWLARLC
jgi:hypothetical protein